MSRGLVVRPVALLALFGALILILDYGCTPEPEEVRLVPNQAPETVISGAPLDSSNVFHRYQVFWTGFDPDGTIVEYYVAVTDSNITPTIRDFQRTTRTDSIFEFTANNEVVLSHAVWVYAVDNEGARDEEPAVAFFNAIDTNRPIPLIVEARKIVGGIPGPLSITEQDTIPTADSSIWIRWTATDADIGGSISGYRIKLSTDNQFTEIPADSTSVTYTGLLSGNYQFLLEAIDNAGAESLDPATIRWVVNYEPDVKITQMFVSNRSGFVEIQDFRDTPPTIRDSSRVLLFFEGNDSDGTVIDYSIRRIRCDIIRLSCQSWPFGSYFIDQSVSMPQPPVGTIDTTRYFFTANDYYLVVRSRDDEGKPDGTPDSVFFHVDYAPVLDPASLFPAEGDELSGAGVDSLDVRFRADDVESGSLSLSYRVILDGVYGLVVGPVSTPDDLFDRWPFPDPGEHTMTITVDDPGRRMDTRTIRFSVLD